jgi:hypothetical protein
MSEVVLEVWSKKDIENHLSTICSTLQLFIANSDISDLNPAYLQGFADALQLTAKSFGCSLPEEVYASAIS